MWSFFDDYQPLSDQLRRPIEVEFENTIVGTAHSRSFAGDVYEDCVHVSRAARAIPETAITCRDGSTSRVVTVVRIENWYAPGVGSVFEQTVETHFKLDRRDEVCYEIESEYIVIAFHGCAGEEERSQNP